MRAYYETIHIIERLHRQSLDVLKLELDRLGIQDINNVQSLILYSIGSDQLTVGELTLRGYYLGSNVSYNLKKMVEFGLSGPGTVAARPPFGPHQGVAQGRLAAGQAGRFLRARRSAARVHTGWDAKELTLLGEMLNKLERFWSGADRPAATRRLTRPVPGGIFTKASSVCFPR